MDNKRSGSRTFASEHPELVNEWNYEKNGGLGPEDYAPFSNKRVWWKCSEGHEWATAVANRSYGNRCPYCMGVRTIKGENDLLTTHPEITTQWHPTKNGNNKPQDYKSGSREKVWWICEKGHEWEASIYDRVRGTGCPYCTNRKTIKGKDDLLTVHPEFAAQWHPTKNGDSMPQDYKVGSRKKVWWMCEKGHEWETTIRGRGNTCPYCSGRRTYHSNKIN